MSHSAVRLHLEEGNQRFREQLEKSQEARIPLNGFFQFQKSQSPSCAVLSCADSRVSPELVFNSGPGGLFVVRSAGNVPDSFSLASLEFAVANLGSKAILVLGHTSCGAISGAKMSADQGRPLPTPHLENLGAAIRKSVIADAPPGQSLDDLVALNVAANIERLINLSELIGDKWRSREVEILGGVYCLKTGKVQFLE